MVGNRVPTETFSAQIASHSELSSIGPLIFICRFWLGVAIEGEGSRLRIYNSIANVPLSTVVSIC